MAAIGYITVLKAMSQGDIKGECMRAGYEQSVEFFEFNHSMYIPTDQLSGAPTGQRRHNPAMFMIALGKHTPPIMQACATGETIMKLEAVFVRINQKGQEEQFMKITLENAIIIKVEHCKPFVMDKDGKNYPDYQKIHLTFAKITIDAVKDSIVAADDWLANAGR